MSIHLGIDSGTQSTKGVAFDLSSGKIVAEARAPHRLIANLPPGHMEQHPQEWARALDRVLRELATRIDARRVRGIGVSGQQHGFVALDAAGEVIRPAKLWCDTATVEECAILSRALGGTRGVLRETGMPFLPGYTAPKILWLKRHEPRNFRRLRHVLLPHDYLNYSLTRDLRHLRMEYGDASGTALLDVRKRKWSRRVADAIDRQLIDFLPAVGASHASVGIVHPKLAKRYGFGPDVVVSAGGGDNMMGAIGTGNVTAGVVTASLGTSGTIYAYSDKPVVDPRGEIAAFCSSNNGWLPLLCTMSVTLVTEHVRGLFGLDYAAFEKAAGSIPPGARGLMMLPYLDGERTPNLPRATGVLHGLTRQTFEPAHLARAALEGVTLNLNYGLQRLQSLGIRPREIRVTGGGAKSRLWRSIAADVFGVPVVGMAIEESAALGAALQAASCIENGREDRNRLTALCRQHVAVNPTTRHSPNRKRHAAYRELQTRHDDLSQTLRAFFV